MNTRLPAAERRQQLLTVATELFGSGGYTGPSVSEIAAAAGVTKPVVYQHFASKHALFLEVLRECSEAAVRAVVDAVETAANPRELVERGYAAFAEHFANNPASFFILFSDATRSDPVFGQEVKGVEQRFAERVARLIAVDGLEDSQRMLLAYGMLGLAQGALRHWIEHDDGTPPQRVGELIGTLAWAGLRQTR